MYFASAAASTATKKIKSDDLEREREELLLREMELIKKTLSDASSDMFRKLKTC